MHAIIDPNEDVVRRGISRDLPCKLTEEEFVRISRTRVQREAERDELEADLFHEVKKRKEQIKERDDEIAKMRRELHTGHQDRTIKCNEVFRKHNDGTGWIYVVRLDELREVERRPASAAEMQRYLPSIPEGGGLLDQARTAQAAEVAAEPERAAGGDDVPSDEPASEVDEIAADEDARRAPGSETASEDTSSDEDTAGASESDRPKKKRRGRS